MSRADDGDEEVFKLTREQKAWVSRLEKLLNAMPSGIELLVGQGSLTVHEQGWYRREVWDAGADMMLAGALIDEGAFYRLYFDADLVRPNSETI